MKPDKFYNHTAGPASACCTGRGVVAQVIKRLEFWLFLLVHIGVSYAWRAGYVQNWAEMSMSFLHAPWHEAGVVTLITVLSELAYLGRCYDIHVRVHDLTRQMVGALTDFAFRARICMQAAGHPQDQVACRFLIVSMTLFLLEVRGFTRGETRVAEPGETWVTSDDWTRFQEKKLLRADEVAFLRNLTFQQRSHFLLREAGRLTNEGLAKARAPPEAAEDFAGTLLSFRQRQEQALEAARLSVPFAYFHLLSLMVMMNMLFWAFALGMTMSYFSHMFYVLSLVLSLAILELAAGLARPFGDSRENIPAAEWVEEAIENVNALLDYKYAGASGNWKLKLEKESKTSVKLDLGADKVRSFLRC